MISEKNIELSVFESIPGQWQRQEGQTHLSYPIHPGTIYIYRRIVETCLEVCEDIVDDPLPL